MLTHTRAAVDLRLTRAAIFALVCVSLSMTGHTFASGDTVPVSAMAAGWFAVFACAALLAGRERSLPGIAGLLLGGQLVLHVLFSSGQGHRGHEPGGSRLGQLAAGLLCGRGTDPGAAGEAFPAHLSHTPDAGTGADGMCSAVGSSLPMFLGHVAAALVTGWILYRGELALWSLTALAAGAAQTSVFPLRTALALLRALRNGLAGAVAPPRAPSLPAPRPGPGRLLLRHCVGRRGPPGFALAA